MNEDIVIYDYTIRIGDKIIYDVGNDIIKLLRQIQQENQQLKEKLELRNKEKSDICNQLQNYKDKNKRLKSEITNLLSINKTRKEKIDYWVNVVEELEKWLDEELWNLQIGWHGQDMITTTEVATKIKTIRDILNKIDELKGVKDD